MPGAGEVARRLLALADAPAASARLGAVRRAIGTRIILNMARAAAAPATGSEASAVIDQALADWAGAQGKRRFASAEDRAWALSTARLIGDREALAAALRDTGNDVPVPPGMPIG